MQYGASLLSLIFFICSAVYLFLGLYAISGNPRAQVNQYFLVLCLALGLWALGFAMGNSAGDAEAFLVWKRVSAFGWGPVYGISLGFVLGLTERWREAKPIHAMIHVPSAVAIGAFAFSSQVSSVQYDLVKAPSGWVSAARSTGWIWFARTYQGVYLLLCLGLLIHWQKSSATERVTHQALAIVRSVTGALALGIFISVIPGSRLTYPELSPLLALIPAGTTYVTLSRRSPLEARDEDPNEPIMGRVSRARLHFYFAMAYLAGGILTSVSYFFPGMVMNEGHAGDMLQSAGILMAFGFAILAFQLVKDGTVRNALVMAILLVSIPVTVLRYVKYVAVTVWVFPLIPMLAAVMFDTKWPLVLLTATSIITELLVWVKAPRVPVVCDEFDHILRIGVFGIAFWVGSFVNTVYVRRLEENLYQLRFQKLVSEVSFDFMSVSGGDLDSKIDILLARIGRFFGVDRTYLLVVLSDRLALMYTHSWCAPDIGPGQEVVHSEALHVSSWWMERFRAQDTLCISDVDELPTEALVPRTEPLGHETRSLALVPIRGVEDLAGYMGLDMLTSRKQWTEDHEKLLAVLSNLLADGVIRVRAAARIERMAYYDDLTGLPNTALFTERLTQAIGEASKAGDHIGVMVLNLDTFKTLNDTLGPTVGDAILKQIGQGLAERVFGGGVVARSGGDEFLVMIDGTPSMESLLESAEEVMGLFRHPLSPEGHEFYVTASAGLAIYPQDGEEPEALLKNADIALYEAKAAGRNQVVLCTSAMKGEVERNVRLSNNLYRALERDEFAVYYQPQVRLATGQIIGLEALLRWRHPELGMVPPNLFIPLAEVNGTINEIGEWVLSTAIRQNVLWQDMGIPNLRMAVNLSVIQLNDPSFVRTVDRLLRDAGMDPRQLELEITESAAVRGIGDVAVTLGRFKDLGVTISIDDFGTEYSSLNRLRILPVDRIKIDMQFVQGIERGEKDQAIIKVIINLAKSLGLGVLAEGVETAPQLDFLHQGMCDEVQGFYYYRPMPKDDVEALLRASTAVRPGGF